MAQARRALLGRLSRTAAALAALGTAGGVAADPPPGTAAAPAAPAAEARALELYQSARAAYTEGDYASAAARFEESLALHVHPNTLLNLGLTYERLGALRRAVDYFDRYLASGWALDAERIRVRVQRLRERPSVLRIQTTPPGALVTLDDEPAPSAATPLRLEVPPGQHRVRLALEGHRSVERSFEAGLGEDVALELRLEPIPGTLRVTSREPLEAVEIDGTPVPPSGEPQAVSPGLRTILARSRAGAVRGVVPVTAGAETSVHLELDQAPPEVIVREHDGAATCRAASRAPEAPWRARLAWSAGAAFALDVAGRGVPASPLVRVGVEAVAPATGLTVSAGPYVAVSLAGGSEQGHASEAGVGWLLDLGARAETRWLDARGLRVGVAALVGMTALVGVPNGGRMRWFPDHVYVRSGDLLAPTLGLELSAGWAMSRALTLTATPVSFEHTLAYGGLDGLPAGLTRVASLVTLELTP